MKIEKQLSTIANILKSIQKVTGEIMKIIAYIASLKVLFKTLF